VKPRVNLADLVARRVPLLPREAATLTLAVAREWDRQRTLHGPIALPHVGAIELTDAGTIVFLLLPRGSGVISAAALSELLKCLLGIHDREAEASADDRATPHQRIPGGLLIMMSGRLGSMELPSNTPAGFREALARFADDTPTALRAVYWRGVTARSRESRSACRVKSSVRRPERRATVEQVNELRRCIRTLERHAFERVRKPWGGAIRVAMVAALIAVAVGIGLLASRVQPSQPSALDVDARPVLTQPADRPLAVPGAQAQPQSSGHSAVRRRDVRAGERSVPVRRQAVRDTRAANEQQERRQNVAGVAGGTRGIAWLR